MVDLHDLENDLGRPKLIVHEVEWWIFMTLRMTSAAIRKAAV
jgi:hypothetical protein